MQRRFLCCYESWIQGQRSALTELLRASAAPGSTDMQLRAVIERCMRLYQQYLEQRRMLLLEDGPAFFCPPWCSSLENSMLWMGGCRASLMVRLLYSLTGLEMEEFLQHMQVPARVGLMHLSAHQLHLLNELHQRTLLAEDRLSSRLATLQEDLADKPLLPLIRESQHASQSVQGFDAGQNGGVRAVMQIYAHALARLVEEADALRMATTRALVEMLSPRQAVELLVAAKQLHLSVHAWGSRRDQQHGRG